MFLLGTSSLRVCEKRTQLCNGNCVPRAAMSYCEVVYFLYYYILTSTSIHRLWSIKMNQDNFPPYNSALLPTSTMATVSLVAGLLGFTVFPLLGGLVALWAGYAARKETRAIPPTATGDGLATAGIVMGWVQLVLGVVGICC